MTSAAGPYITRACLPGHALMGCEPNSTSICAPRGTAICRCMYSLQGLAGAVCLWLDTLDPQHAAFPGYDL